MDIISTVDLRKKEIINLCDGGKLGYACDFEFNKCSAQIVALVLNKGSGFFGIGADSFIIPWNKIECIGEDTILVNISSGELSCGSSECKKKKRFF